MRLRVAISPSPPCRCVCAIWKKNSVCPLVNRGQRFEGFTAPGERVLAWARTVLAAYDGLQAEAAACRGTWSAHCAWV